MSKPQPFLRALGRSATPNGPSIALFTRASRTPRFQCLRQPLQRRFKSTQPADNPDFESILDKPVRIMRSGKQHGPGLIILALIPVTAFILGTWQVQRLAWKTTLLASLEDRLVRPPLPLPPNIDPAAIPSFDYRRVYATGILRHDLEMLVGPRLHDGDDGYLVVTPLERTDDAGKKARILVCRGWIRKDKADQKTRAEGLPRGEVTVQGLLREPWKKNMFTPVNSPARGLWHFPDVGEMAQWTGSQAVWIEETMRPDLLLAYDREAKGVPIGRPAEVNIRNNHTQYIFTWYALSAFTTVMLWMVVKKPPSNTAARVRHSTQW
ncbi:SURF1-domain-containing protein [Mytilinidion resinicola]|uniref:SURF1-like protein n=1 Tax=Mytilinidion resinicola TaxID=574789 RepID=A0A6A6Y994_9PEZI|nr:SURF1-domain-containing protein [Mytilinidion resinicola]KAF2805391.1 SURF1-domain-containing protein [Mytilinidion resinicola]